MAGFNPDDARIFRITHIDNVPWILEHGLHCKSSATRDPDFVSIGNTELIDKRTTHQVECGQGGALSDYVPFYFTPHSIMLYNIKTGYQGVTKRSNEEIVILATSIHRLAELDIPFVFYDGHAFMYESTCYTDVSDLDKIDWKLLASRNFSRDPDDPGKKGRYQAEALVYEHLPASALLGIGCYNSSAERRVTDQVKAQGLTIPVKKMPNWYF